MPRLPGTKDVHEFDCALACVVPTDYALEPTGSAPYTTGRAGMLAAHGAQVQLATSVPGYPQSGAASVVQRPGAKHVPAR